MKGFVQNLKLKRVLAMFLVISIFLTTFLTSVCIDTKRVYADSNDRRSSLMNLSATGKQQVKFTSLEDVKNIDETSLRVIALYLTNFYIPWQSSIDTNFKPADAESDDKDDDEKSNDTEANGSVSQDYKINMVNALVKHCSFDKKTAKYIVDYIIQENLATCQPVYMKKSDLELMWKTVLLACDHAELAKHTTIGFYNRHYNQTDTTIGGWNISSDIIFSEDTFVRYKTGLDSDVDMYDNKKNGFQNYVNYFGTKKVEGDSTEYVPVTYPVFLSVMDQCYRVASLDTLDENDKSNKAIISYKKSFDTYNINNRKDATDSDDIDKEFKEKIPLVQFWTNNKEGSFAPIFSNNEECMQAYAMVQNFVDIKNGYSSGFLAVGINNSFYKNAAESSASSDYALALGQQMYTNWVGDLVIDTGKYRLIALPGCCNPYMLSTVTAEASASGAYADTIPSQNLFAIASVNNGWLKYEGGTGLGGDGTESNRLFVFTDGGDSGGSLFNLAYWRLYQGTKQVAFDESLESDKIVSRIADTVNNSELGVADAIAFDDDEILFPSWMHIAQSPTYNNTVDSKAVCHQKCSVMDNLKSKGSGYDEMATLNARDEYGHVVYNGNFIYLDTFKGVDPETKLGEFFGHGSITESTTLNEMKKINITNFTMGSVNKLYSNTASSLVNTFNNETYTSLFTSLFLSYSLAYFNEESGKTEYKKNSDDTNCINLKTHFDNFPSYTNNIDWSNIFGSTMQEEIMSFLYYLLHPTEGISYVATWLKNKIGGFLLKWHEDIVGSTDSNSTTGMTKYLGFSGYTTVPSLNDIDWVANLLDMYNNIIVYLIIVMCLIMLCYILTGSVTLQRGIIGVVAFSMLSFLPPYAINMVVDTSNKVSSTVYSSKFDYWALCQMQTYLSDFANAVKSRGDKDMSSYTAFVLSNQSKTSNSIGGTPSTYYGGVRLKWMSPKKYSTMAAVSDALTNATEGTQATYLRNFVINAVSNATSNESFVDNNGSALYLYREYTDIYRYAVGSYHVMDTYNYDGTLMSKEALDSNLVLGATAGKYGCSIIRVAGKKNEYNSVLDNIKNFENALDIDNLSEGEKKIYNETPADQRTFKDSKGIRTANAVLFRDLITANTMMHKDKTGLQLDGAKGKDTALYGTSSIWSVSTGFLYDTIKLEDQLADTKTKYASYYNYTQGNTCFTLSSAYLMNYNQAWGITAKQKERLQAIADGKGKLSYKSEITDVGSTSKYKDAISNTELLGLPLDYYAGSISGIQNIEGLADDKSKAGSSKKIWQDLSSYFYGLYTESPFYYFNFNIRDQIAAFPGTNYMFDPEDPGNSGTDDDNPLNNVTKLMLSNNQEYFFNLSENAGSGHGELRDFMNMHDLFYYVVPALKQGVDLARLYDDLYRFELDEDCAVHFNSNTGKITYVGKDMDLESFMTDYYQKDGEFTEEEKYKIWHTLNNYSILNAYSAWLDTMMDCKYAEAESIRVQGEKFRVNDPLCPTSYFQVDANGNMIAGRYMVFSRSEMAYYGLDESDLTTVERKIINIQDNVYDTALDLMNYYTMSDETLIQALSMIELFEFNKEFSQESFFGKDYVMYPQGYELKAFSYDAYMRLIVSQASGEDLMTGGGEDELGNTQTNKSIYTRIQENTSLFFSIFLLFNDLLAVYIIPGFKIFFILLIFLSSILLIIASAIKLELNMANVTWKSLIAPLLSFLAISIGTALLVAMFMSNGASGVVDSGMVIDLGDPTMVTIVMLVINVIATILYFRLIKKAVHDCRTYTKTIAENVGGTAAGVLGAVVGSVSKGRDFSSHSGHNISSTASQRGKDNSPASGQNSVGVGSALAAGAGAAGIAGMLSKKEQEQAEKTNERADASAVMNRWDKKAYAGANAREDKARAKYEKLAHKAELQANRNGDGETPGKASKLTTMRLNHAKAKLDRKQQYSDDIKKYGRIHAKKKQIGRAFNSIKGKAQSAGSTVKTGASRLGSLTKAAGNKAKDKQTYYNAGVKVAQIGNTGRNTVRKVKKGVVNAPDTVKSGVKRGAVSAVQGVRNKTNSAVQGVRNSVRSGINKGRAGLSSARTAVNNSRTFVNDAHSSYRKGYTQTKNKK